MNTIICHDCGRDVVRGRAFIRSVSFEQVGWCTSCWEKRDHPIGIPTPRPATDLAVSQTATRASA